MQFIPIADDLLINADKILSFSTKVIGGKKKITIMMDNGSTHVVEKDFAAIHGALIRSGITGTEQFWGG